MKFWCQFEDLYEWQLIWNNVILVKFGYLCYDRNKVQQKKKKIFITQLRMEDICIFIYQNDMHFWVDMKHAYLY